MSKKNSITILQNFTTEELTSKILDGLKSEIENFKIELESSKSEKYLTRAETTKMLNISLTCVNDWGKKGILKPLKMGNRTYFKLSDIEEKLDNSNKR